MSTVCRRKASLGHSTSLGVTRIPEKGWSSRLGSWTNTSSISGICFQCSSWWFLRGVSRDFLNKFGYKISIPARVLTGPFAYYCELSTINRYVISITYLKHHTKFRHFLPNVPNCVLKCSAVQTWKGIHDHVLTSSWGNLERYLIRGSSLGCLWNVERGHQG